jgi:hypothetical protein
MKTTALPLMAMALARFGEMGSVCAIRAHTQDRVRPRGILYIFFFFFKWISVLKIIQIYVSIGKRVWV